MDKRVTLALENLKKTNYYMIGLILQRFYLRLSNWPIVFITHLSMY